MQPGDVAQVSGTREMNWEWTWGFTLSYLRQLSATTVRTKRGARLDRENEWPKYQENRNVFQ